MDDTLIPVVLERGRKLETHFEGNAYKHKSSMYISSVLYFNKALISSFFMELGIVSSLAQEKANLPSTTQVTIVL